jgi:hypothetical protein
MIISPPYFRNSFGICLHLLVKWKEI